MTDDDPRVVVVLVCEWGSQMRPGGVHHPSAPGAGGGGGLRWWTRGRFRTVQHLVEKHGVDIHVRVRDVYTALDLAELHGVTEKSVPRTSARASPDGSASL
jgi:hypothetical protein